MTPEQFIEEKVKEVRESIFPQENLVVSGTTKILRTALQQAIEFGVNSEDIAGLAFANGKKAGASEEGKAILEALPHWHYPMFENEKSGYNNAVKDIRSLIEKRNV